MNSLDVAKQLKPGSLFYEYFDGEVHEYVTLITPTRNDDGYWQWKARAWGPNNPNSKETVNFGVHENYLAYAPELSLAADNLEIN